AFKEQLPTGNLDKASALLPEASPVALLRISRLHLQQIVVEGSTPSDLKLGPGHLRVSPLPGEVGNSVILGRRTTYGAPFAGLPLLKNGDRISVTTGRGVFTYVVSATGRSARTDAGPMLANANNVLTLVTSDPLLQATDRYWVRAKLSGKAVAIASRAPAAANPDDLGLTSEFGPLILAVIASQLLVGTGWLAWRYRRHWPGTVTYLLAAPILVALLLVTFSYFDAMLPGTL
ncbi:MAG: class E sortase, partial [Actinobacteria bacterium]|nr:class E sortase [Actinomycetota bacterium]